MSPASKMANVSDCFTIGSLVSVKTCYNQDVEGEVLAFDQPTKMLILKCTASSGRTALNDVHILNLSLAKDIKVKQESSTNTPATPQSLNLHRLNTRARNQVEQKRRLVTALSAGVCPEGQKLFIALSKTIREVSWSGPNIVVYRQVTIIPPYKPDSIRGNSESKEYTYVRKVVEKHQKDQSLVSLAPPGNVPQT